MSAAIDSTVSLGKKKIQQNNQQPWYGEKPHIYLYSSRKYRP